MQIRLQTRSMIKPASNLSYVTFVFSTSHMKMKRDDFVRIYLLLCIKTFKIPGYPGFFQS